MSMANQADWTTGPFQCHQDPSGCLDNFCCWPCSIGRQCMALEGNTNTADLAGTLQGFCVCAHCIVRHRIRDRFGIEGNACGDVLLGLLCPVCVHAQNHRELTHRGFWPGGVLFHRSPPNGMA
eukprot:PhM_4_TR9594/c0_g1_i1/m.42816